MFNGNKVKLYDYLLGGSGIFILFILMVIKGFKFHNILLFIFLVILEIFIDRFKIHSGKIWISFSSIIEISSFLIMGTITAAWIQIIFILVSDYIIHRKPVQTVILNIGMSLFRLFTGAMIYNYFYDNLVNSGSMYFSIGMLIAVILFSIGGFICNYILIFVQLKLSKGEHLKVMLYESMVWEIISMAISIPAALEFTNLYKFSKNNNLLFAFLFLLPIILICISFILINNLIFTNKQLKGLSKVALSINSYLNLDQTYNCVIDTIKSLLSFNGCYIFSIDETENEMKPVAYSIENKDKLFNLKNDQRLFENIFCSLKPIVCNDLEKYSKNNECSEYCKVYKSCILVPMRRINRCVGCIGIFSDERSAYNKDILEFLMILSDQATVAIENARLYKLSGEEAITDGLTYLYNQKYFYKYLNEKIDNYMINPFKMSLILFDVDFFKKINDSYGHIVGDHVLKEVSKIIKNSVRKNDIVSRYGGEEFTVILPDLNCEEAYVIAERIRNKIENYDFIINGIKIKITISGGITEYPKIASNALEIIEFADKAMYIGAKFSGRNKIKVYDDNL